MPYRTDPTAPIPPHLTRRWRVLSDPWQAMIALAAIMVGLAGAVEPATVEHVEEYAPHVVRAWSVGYAAAGVAMLAGLGSGRIGVEVMGLSVLAGSLVASTVAAVAVEGYVEAAATTVTRGLFVAAALLQVYRLLRVGRAVPLPPDAAAAGGQR